MFKLNFLPTAKKDMDDIIYYISNIIKNKTAAHKLANDFINGANSILEFPYASPIYKTTKRLRQDFRIFKIKNFLMFYTINEKDKEVTIVRVLYQKMDVNKRLKG
ncbi:MAG: type II toxin-antitoxin system RelE/ParE family toxin [Bacilli bacterium]|nr:type II toxin-antitoxin system RelE/ParE family toxin [Bacilli bacterium]